MNCLFIFVMQVSLACIIMGYKNMSSQDSSNDMTQDDPTMQYDPFILITRFVCAIILHLQIAPEILQAINLMGFSINRTGNSNRKFPLFSIAMMQFIGALLTEIINLLVICQETSPANIVQNLLAFGVICQIDDFYAGTLQNNIAQNLLNENATLSFEKLGRDGRDNLDVNRSKLQRFINFVFHII